MRVLGLRFRVQGQGLGLETEPATDCSHNLVRSLDPIGLGFVAQGVWADTQSLQNPSIKEYTLNYIRDPIII